MPINRDQWELGAKTKHQRIGVFNLSTTVQPLQDSVGASGFTLTLRVRLAWCNKVKSTSIAVSTRVRLSGSVEISNLTTALHLQRNQFQSERLSSI